MPLKSALTRIPGIVFHVGKQRWLADWKPTFYSALTSFRSSLPGAFLISHCRHRRRRRRRRGSHRRDISFSARLASHPPTTRNHFSSSFLPRNPRCYITKNFFRYTKNEETISRSLAPRDLVFFRLLFLYPIVKRFEYSKIDKRFYTRDLNLNVVPYKFASRLLRKESYFPQIIRELYLFTW